MKNSHINLLIGFLFTSLLVSFIWGCAPQVVTKTEYIQTPTFCEVSLPSRPVIQNSSFQNIVDYDTFMSNLRNILIYTDELEMALICCTNSHDCITRK